METTKNEMPQYAKEFFFKLGMYLDTPIYYFGSVQRADYFPTSSDIDVDLFSDNESSIIIKLQNFLGLEKYKFKKFVYKLHKTQKIVYGHKVKYEDPSNNFFTEISIYNDFQSNWFLRYVVHISLWRLFLVVDCFVVDCFVYWLCVFYFFVD